MLPEQIRIEGARLPLGRERYTHLMAAGASLADMIAECKPDGPVATTVNGVPVERSDWSRIRPPPGAIVTVAPEAGLEFVITALVATALSVTASLLLPRPEQPDAEDPMPRIEGGSNAIAPWMPLPVVFGKLRYAPIAVNKWIPYLAGASTAVRARTGIIPGQFPTGTPALGANVWQPIGASAEQKQWIRTLLCWGLGTIDITDIKLGATLATEYGDGVSLMTATGDNSDFANATRLVEIDADLNGATTVKRFLGKAESNITVNLVWPRGLFRVNNKGETHGFDEPMGTKPERRPVLLTIKILAEDGTELASRDVSAVGGTTEAPFHQAEAFTISSAQNVTLSVERKTAARDSLQVNDDLKVHSAVIPLTDAPINGYSTTNTSVRIQATDQLSGTIPVISGVGHAHRPDWDEDTDMWTVRATRNPASAFRDVLMGDAIARPYLESGVLMTRLQDWHEWCTDQGFTYDAVHTRQTSVDSLLEQIAAAGRARPAWIGDQRGVVIDRAQARRVQVFTPSNLRDLRGSRASKPVPHALRCRFRDQDKDYAIAEVRVYRPGYTSANATLIEQRTLNGIVRRDTVSALLAYQMRSGLARREKYEFQADWEHLVATVGDRVAVLHDAIDVEALSGRVLEAVNGRPPDTDLPTGARWKAVRVNFINDLTIGTTYTAVVRRGEDVTSFPVRLTTTSKEAGFIGLQGPRSTRPDVEVGDLIAVHQAATGIEDCFLESIEPAGDAGARLSMVQYGGESVFSAQSGYTVEYIDPEGEIADVPFGAFEQARRPANVLHVERVAFHGTETDQKPARPAGEDIPDNWSATDNVTGNFVWISRQVLTVYPLVADPAPATYQIVPTVYVPVGSEVDAGVWSEPEPYGGAQVDGGVDGFGIEEAYALFPLTRMVSGSPVNYIQNGAIVIPESQQPLSTWPYDILMAATDVENSGPITRDGIVWEDGPRPPTESHPIRVKALRSVPGQPEHGAAPEDTWGAWSWYVDVLRPDDGTHGLTYREIPIYRKVGITAATPGAPSTPTWDGSALGGVTGWSADFPAYNPLTEKVACVIVLVASDDSAEIVGSVRICESPGDINAVFRRSENKPARLADGSARVPTNTYDTDGSVPAGDGSIWVAVGHRSAMAANYTWSDWTRLEGTDGADGVSYREIPIYRKIGLTAATPAAPSSPTWDGSTLGGIGSYSTAFPSYDPNTEKVACAIVLVGSDDSAAVQGSVRICESPGDINAVFRRAATKPARLADSNTRLPASTYDTDGTVPAGAGSIWVSVGNRAPNATVWKWSDWEKLEGTDGKYAAKELDVYLVVNAPASGGSAPGTPTATRYAFETDGIFGLTANWVRTRPLTVQPGQLVYCSTVSAQDDGTGEDSSLTFSAPVVCNDVLDIDIIYGRFATAPPRPANTAHNVIATNFYARPGLIPANVTGTLYECVRYLKIDGNNIRWEHDDPYAAEGATAPFFRQPVVEVPIRVVGDSVADATSFVPDPGEATLAVVIGGVATEVTVEGDISATGVTATLGGANASDFEIVT